MPRPCSPAMHLRGSRTASGMPVIGMTPRTIPTLTTSWNTIIEATPAAKRVPNASRERHPETRTRHRSRRTGRREHATDEPELLGECREHEVRRLDRQEIALGLRPVGQALADESARTDRDLRLVQLVAGALDVRCGSRKRRSRSF